MTFCYDADAERSVGWLKLAADTIGLDEPPASHTMRATDLVAVPSSVLF